jgi:hypothetical protein
MRFGCAADEFDFDGDISATGMSLTEPLSIVKNAEASTRENVLRASISDAGNDAFFIFNATTTNGRFFPAFGGYLGSVNSSYSLGFQGFVPASNDASDSATSGIIDYTVMRTSSASDPPSGVRTVIQNRKLFSWRNLTTMIMYIDAAMNINIDGDKRIKFRDNDIYINSTNDGYLDAFADTGIRLSTPEVTLGKGTAGVDYALKFDGESNDGLITWMEDEDYFKFDDSILFPDSEPLYFGTGVDASILYDGTDLIINPKVVGSGELKLQGDLSATTVKSVHKAADGTAAVADGTYTLGLGGTTNGTITIKDGIITAVQQCVA